MTTLNLLILTAQSRRINICLFCAVFLFLPLSVYAQWTGTGTAQNPFKIYTLQDLEEINTNETVYNSYQNIHFELMNNITDTLRDKLSDKFYGYFHGKGHYITLGFNEPLSYSTEGGDNGTVYNYYNNVLISQLFGTIDSLTLFGKVINFTNLFNYIKTGGKLLDIVFNTEIEETTNFRIFAQNNYGIMENCINNSNIQLETLPPPPPPTPIPIFALFIFVKGNSGQIINCVNNGNITIRTNQTPIMSFLFCENNGGTIINCINNGDLKILDVPMFVFVSCFSFYNGGTIQNCINTGNINAKGTTTAAAFANFNYGTVKNCLNTGYIQGDALAGGIVGLNQNRSAPYDNTIYYPSYIENCLNTGFISGYEVGGIVGRFENLEAQQIVKNNIDISKTSANSLFGSAALYVSAYQNPLLVLENNFYDKQMAPQAATIIGDIPENNAAKGLLTTEITGFALQSVLGNGWSYAEGRYPIPLGLENHPAALLAATPVYLHADNSENYNTIDSVSQNFTVSLENNVQWQVLYDNVLLQEENAIIQNFGNELLTGSLDNYSKKIPIIIKPIQSSIPTTEFNEIFIYPNPVKDELKIMNYELRIMNVEILDITGKKILIPHSSLLDTHYLILDTNSLPQGIYFVKIYADKGNKIGKFIKN